MMENIENNRKIRTNKNLIEIEGIDGVGKTTQCVLLNNLLNNTGYPSIVIKELQDSDIGESIKQIIQDNELDKETEALLFLANKYRIFSNKITPFLKDGSGYVITDRGIGSFLSYNYDVVDKNNIILKLLMEFTLHNVLPGKTYLLDLPVDSTINRIKLKNEKSKFDLRSYEDLEYQRQHFLGLAKVLPNRKIIDASLSISEIHDIIKNDLFYIINNDELSYKECIYNNTK